MFYRSSTMLNTCRRQLSAHGKKMSMNIVHKSMLSRSLMTETLCLSKTNKSLINMNEGKHL